MALLRLGPSSFASPLKCNYASHKHSKTRIPTTIFVPKNKFFSLSIYYLRSIKCYNTSLQTFFCSSNSSPSSSMLSDNSPSNIGVFIKGLPLSMTEGRLKSAFSQFGEVRQVEIAMEKKSKQSIGYAFIWFTSEDSAHLAAKEMNGKFFDGRFIFVDIANPDLSKPIRRMKGFEF